MRDVNRIVMMDVEKKERKGGMKVGGKPEARPEKRRVTGLWGE